MEKGSDRRVSLGMAGIVQCAADARCRLFQKVVEGKAVMTVDDMAMMTTVTSRFGKDPSVMTIDWLCFNLLPQE